jgi:predicted ester cyclase
MRLQERAARPSGGPLALDASPCLFLAAGACRGLAWAARRASQPVEDLQILRINGPDRAHLDPKEPLRDQQATDVGFGCAEARRGLDDGEWTWAIDSLIILARRRNNLSQNLLECDGPRTEARALKAPVRAALYKGLPARFLQAPILALQTRNASPRRRGMADVKDSAARFVKAFNAHDEHVMRVLNDPNGTFEAPGGIHLQGREASSYAMTWLKACPDGKLSVRNELIRDPWVVEEVTFEGTHEGPLDSPAGAIPATGRKLAIKAVLITRYENDLAIEARVYFDQMDVLTQLGALPTPVGATA